MCPQSTSQAGSQTSQSASDDPKREVPQFALDFAASLRQRRAGMEGQYPGASAAERHLYETGHRLEAGCCVKAAERRAATEET